MVVVLMVNVFDGAKMNKIIFILLIFAFLSVGCSPSIVCNNPYIQVGTECCLDQDYNLVCDDYEGNTPKEENNLETAPKEGVPVGQSEPVPVETVSIQEVKPAETTPDNCIATAGLSCLEFIVKEDGPELKVVNGFGTALTVTGVTFTSQDSATCKGGRLTTGTNLAAGDVVTLGGVTECNFIPGNRVRGTFTITYHTGNTSFTHDATIDFSATVQGIPPVIPPSDKCIGSVGIIASNFSVTPSKISITIINCLDFDIFLGEISEHKCKHLLYNGFFDPGESHTFILENCLNGAIGNKLNTHIFIGYQPSGGGPESTQTATINLSSTITKELNG